MMHRDSVLIPRLVARGYRLRGLQQVDLFWIGSGANRFHVYRDGRCVATVGAARYTDRLGRGGAGSYRYNVCPAETGTASNEAAVTFTAK